MSIGLFTTAFVSLSTLTLMKNMSGDQTCICNLISSMFDSVHRELSGNEPNTSMTDVDHDLQLIIGMGNIA